MTDFAAQRTMMVDTQVRPSDVTKFPIIDAMLSVPREDFVPDTARAIAYMDGPVSLGGGRAMLEPRTLGKLLDALDVQRDELVLDIGCGLGYSAAVISHMAEAVVAVEMDEALAGEAELALSRHGADNVAVIAGPLAEGAAKHGPYDAIVVEGGTEQIPHALTDQLKDGGRIAVLEMSGALGACKIGHKEGDRLTWRFAFNATAPIMQGFEKDLAFQL